MKIIAILLLTGAAAYAGESKPVVDITNMSPAQISHLAGNMLDYGMWREEHDRNTFPIDMPKVGEPYDPVTGNAIHKLGTVNPLPKGDLRQ
jgi:hypothetical protein